MAGEGNDNERDARNSLSLAPDTGVGVVFVIWDAIVGAEHTGLTFVPLKNGNGGKRGRVTEKGGGGDVEVMPPKKGSGGSVMFVLADDGTTGVKAGKEKHTYSTS